MKIESFVREVVVIDHGVEDHETLVCNLRKGIKTHFLNHLQDGVVQLTNILKQYSNLDAIHIVSHGHSGCLILGNSLLTSETLGRYQKLLFSWQQALNNSADILLYGCEVGKGEAGEAFIQQLAAHTHANIAASTNLTGNKQLNGDWELGYRVGSVSAQFPFNACIIESYPAVLPTVESFTGFVNGTNRAPSFTFNGFTYAINDPSPSPSDLREMVPGGDPLLELGGGLGTTIFSIARADGSEFSLSSLTIRDQHFLGDTYSVSGWRDGVKVTANHNHTLTGTNTNTNSFSGASDTGFLNIDRIEFAGMDVGFSLEDWTFGAAVGSATVTSATYNAATNSLVITGTNLTATAGALNDINVSKLTLNGQDSASYTLTSSNVEIDSATQFTVGLNTTDQINVEGLLNNNGSSAVDATTFNIAAADDWNSSQAGNADLTGNAVTVSNVQTPTITSATYNASTGSLAITGTNLVKASGAVNDITANKFTLTGEGGATYMLTDSANVEITSGTAFTLTLSATDRAAVNQILNKNGTISTDVSTYNLSAADDWNTVIGNADISDIFGNGITVSNVAAPTITSATYDASTGSLVVTGTGFLSSNGAANDIIANKFTLTGEGGATYTLTDSANVEITSGTAFTLTLSATDRAAINQILNKNGSTSTDISTYNLAAVEDWAAGADAAVVVADLTGNGITVSNVAAPTITSATYDASTGSLVVAGTGFLSSNGAANDIIANKFTLTGEGGATYTLTDSADVEIASGTTFTISLSATDRAAVNQIINKNGTSSNGANTYNLAAAEDWAAGADAAVNIVDASGNGITATIPAPVITSATYDASTGALIVTGTGFLSSNGAANDIIANKFTLTGEGGAIYTLTDSADVEITSGTAFTLTLSATDRAAINQMINKNGTSSNDATTYNLAAAEDWAAGADAAVVVADLTGNGITATVAAPTITSAAYDASTGSLVVSGTDFLSSSGTDIIANKFTLTGEGGATYTLTDSANVEITSGTAFTVTLSATDRSAVNQILNTNGTTSTDISTYNLAAAEDWAAGADAAVVVADLTSNGITVSNVAAPTITSATYDASTGALVVTGTDFLSSSGAANDIIANKFTLIGEGGATYTLNDSANVEITSGTAFTLTLSATDKAAVNQFINKNGTSSNGATTYNLAAAEDWAAGADAAVVVADLTGNGVTVSNVAAPTITSAAYDASTGALFVTGTGFLSSNGAANDIIANKFTLTGEGGATYTLTDSANVEITSGTAFTLTLSATDKAAVNQIINKNGPSSNDATTYNLAAAEDWAAGADPAVNIVDASGNGITATIPTPAITSVTYDASTGALIVTGTDFLSSNGAANDIIANKFTLTGEGGATYTLTDSANVEITSGTAFTLTLSATDRAAINQILNKNGSTSTDISTYNLAAVEDWAAGADAAVVVADLTSNGITVSNVAAPTITSATYDASTGSLVVTGTGFLSSNGAANDIIANKFTLTGEGGATYTLTDSANVEITSGTAFTLTLSATDRAAINQILNKNGSTSTDISTYNLAAVEDWAAGADAAVVVADLTGNGITVSNVAAPTITSATYDASTGSLVVTGTGFLFSNGATNDIIANKLTLTGEGGATYTLTDSADVEITSGTAFTLTLSATDRSAVNQILNKNGTTSTDISTYNLAAAEDWAAGADAAVNIVDATGNGITVSNVAAPTITSAAYDAGTGALVVTGTGFLSSNGAANDIIANKFTLTGEGGATYTLTDSADVEITSGTAFTLTLSATDRSAVNQLINKNGTSSNGATTYNLAAAEDWAAGADAAVNIVDATGNGITVSNVAAPTITSAAYDAGTGALVVTGTGFLSSNGAANDIIANKFTLTGEGGATYTLTDSADVEITSGTAFTLTLSATDRSAVNQLINKNGTSSNGATTYNLAAAEDWAAGADAAVVVADLTGNGVTVSNVAAPTITSAAYDASTGSLIVTGTGFLSSNGAANDIIANKFTLTGEDGATYTLTDSADVEIASGTTFTISLSATDRAAVNQIINKNGTSSNGATTYNLAAAEDWAAGADAAVVVADLTGNGITATVPAPTITSAAYDASTGSLVVSGTDFLSSSGTDIIANKFTLTGEGGATYTLTDSANVEITSGTAFTVTLSATDRSAVNQLINKNGTSSNDATTYNLAAAEDWAAGADAAVVVADLTGNGVTVNNVAAPTITSAAYDAGTGALVVTGTGFLSSNGATNDIIANKFTLTGEGGATYTLSDSANVEITSGTAFTLTLNATDRAAVNQILNKNGTTSTDISTYNLAAAEDWAAGADAVVNIGDATGNGITVSNVAAPTITSAAYDAGTGALVVTGTGFLSSNGATNDIIANKFTLTGEDGAIYTLTDSADVEIASGTTFTISLSATDRAAVNQIINKNGTSSNGATTYNLAAAEDWAAGADAAVVVADLTGNGVTVNNVAAPTITSAAYDASTGALVVTGTGFLSSNGAANDIIATKFTLTGEGGTTYTLTDSADVEITSGTAFTLTLSATDRAAVNQILNKNGTTSTDISTYNLAAAEDWAAGADAVVNIVDATGNGITVSNVAAPTITSAAYDAGTGALVVTGTGFLSSNGAANDIIANKFTLTGEGGATYTLTDSADVEITSGTAFTLTLSATDRSAVNQLINKNGTSSNGATTYNLAAAEDWAAGADAVVNIVDATGNGITVSNVAAPTITSAAYDAGTGALVVTGTGFLSSNGAANDIIANKFTLTGEGGATYTLTDSADVEITSGTAFTLTLSATDRSAVNQLINKNGTSSNGATTYNLAAAEDWAAGADAAVNIVDATGNGITVSNVAAPTITSAAYDASTGALILTGTGFLSSSGVANDIIANKFTLTGEGGATYTLSDSANVEITSGAAFTLTLSTTDKAAVNQLINKNGPSSNDATNYNLAAAEDWAAGADAAVVVADLTGNGITATVPAPTITSAAYDASTGALVVTGTGFLSSNGAANDIIANKFTLTGEGGASYTLSDSANVEITSGTAFTVTLSATDKAAVNQIINKNGTSSNGATTYNLAAAEDWAAGADAAVVVADLTGNGITVSNVAAPMITSAAYDASTGALVVTGTGFLSSNGAANDIIANKFTLTGEGGATYTLTDSADVEITSGTVFTLTLSAADRAAVNQMINKNGSSSNDATTYNLAAAEDWAAGADAAVVVADLTGNGVTVSNVAVPTITSAAYNASSGVLVVAGTNLVSASGGANDIDVSKFTITGQGGTTYTLTDSADVEITTGTAFTLTLSATDKAAVNQIINKNGTSSNDATTYNLAAAEDWAAGADAVVNIVDATGNGITATVPATPPTPTPTPNPNPEPEPEPEPEPVDPIVEIIDGANISRNTEIDGSITSTIIAINESREEDPTSLYPGHADIPILNDINNDPILVVSLPTGVGLSMNGQPGALSTQNALNDLIARIEQQTEANSGQRNEMIAQGQRFLSTLTADDTVVVQTFTPTVSNNQTPSAPIIFTSSIADNISKQAIVIDARNLPSNTVLQLDNVSFSAILGEVSLVGGSGQNYVIGDDHNQFIVLGENDDILSGGGGSDTVGSLGGEDQVNGDTGNDVVYGGSANDILSGGLGDDQLNGGFGFDIANQSGILADYNITTDGSKIIFTHNTGEIDTLTDVELIRFENGETLAISNSVTETAAHHLTKTWLNRDLTPSEGIAIQNWQGANIDNIITAFHSLSETIAFRDKTASELLAGFEESPNIIQLDVSRDVIASDANDQGYLPLGLALNVDGNAGHDVLQMQGNRSDVSFDKVIDALEITQLSDGAMLNLKNAEMIAFDSGENVILAHNQVEGILGRLVQTFLDRDATISEWQLGREALASNTQPHDILEWFQSHANLRDLSDSDYINKLYDQTFGRLPTENELNTHITQLNDSQIDRNWLAVELAGSDEAISVIGSVILLDGGI